MSYEKLDNNLSFSKELVPAFTLEYKYFDSLRHPRDVAIYAQIEKLRYADLPLHGKDTIDFLNKMGISEQEYSDTCEHLMVLGLLIKGN